jgi:pyochelin biosynthetic protein PchC
MGGPQAQLAITRAFRRVGRSQQAGRTGLFCLPYAGGGMNSYDSWAPLLARTADVWVAELPGRGTRFDQPFADDLTLLAGDLAAEIQAIAPPRVALFGHSMGAALAFETALALTAAGAPPLALFVSGHAAPGRRKARLHELSNEELTGTMRQLGGTPGDVFDSPELWELMLDVIRADLTLVERHAHPPGAAVPCPLVAYGSTGDDEADEAGIAGWATRTTGPFATRVFPGDHFYFLEYPEAFATDVIRRLVQHTTEGTP